MKVKEYNVTHDLRICSYIIGSENLDFHKHKKLSDITFCVYGKLLLQIPELKKSIIVHPGEIVKVPKNKWHRIISCNGEEAKYILIQKGIFSIEFNNTLDYKENINLFEKFEEDIDIGFLQEAIKKFPSFSCDDEQDIKNAINTIIN